MWQKMPGLGGSASRHLLPQGSLFSEHLLFICTKVAGALLPKEWIRLPRSWQEGESNGQGGMMAQLTSSHQRGITGHRS